MRIWMSAGDQQVAGWNPVFSPRVSVDVPLSKTLNP